MNLFNEIDTLEHQFHTSSENLSLKKLQQESESKPVTFIVPNQSIGDNKYASSNERNHQERNSGLILVDLFQRLREQPKVTRQLSDAQ